MGLLSALNGSVFDPLVDKATSEENTAEDWALIMDICDRVAVETSGAKECFRSILRRLNSPIPVVVMQSLTLTDALVSNCGKKFHLEVCSRDFEAELRRLITSKMHPKVSERARLLIKKWAKEFKKDPQLSLMPSLYEKLKKEGISFSSSEPKRSRGAIDPAVLKNPDAVGSEQEEADILKAIELSLRESKGGGGGGGATTNVRMSLATNTTAPSQMNNGPSQTSSASLYPTFSFSESGYGATKTSSGQGSAAPAKEPIKVRALYDFEAAEDNELTFKAGEIILVQDSSDANWWKGSNHRGEGLFPANFVSSDLNAEPEPVYNPEKKVQFNEEIKVKVLESESHSETNGTAPVTEIDESRIDRLLHLLHEADPQAEKCDSEELLTLEEQCVSMMPLIDQQIEMVDKRHAALTALNQQLNSALNLYHDLMKESFLMDQAAAAAAAAMYSGGMMPPGTYGGYPHPGMAPQMGQPSPYDLSQMAAALPQGQYNPNAPGPYYSQQQQQPTMAYQQQPPAPQQMTYAPDGSSTQMNGPVQQPQPGMSGPSVQAPGPQQQQPAGPYHQMYQSPTHHPHGQPQSPLASTYQQSQGGTYSTNGPAHYTPEQVMASQQAQQQQMMQSPPHHTMMPPGHVAGAVPNLL